MNFPYPNFFQQANHESNANFFSFDFIIGEGEVDASDIITKSRNLLFSNHLSFDKTQVYLENFCVKKNDEDDTNPYRSVKCQFSGLKKDSYGSEIEFKVYKNINVEQKKDNIMPKEIQIVMIGNTDLEYLAILYRNNAG